LREKSRTRSMKSSLLRIKIWHIVMCRTKTSSIKLTTRSLEKLLKGSKRTVTNCLAMYTSVWQTIRLLRKL
jgi:hypothetical protein